MNEQSTQSSTIMQSLKLKKNLCKKKKKRESCTFCSHVDFTFCCILQKISLHLKFCMMVEDDMDYPFIFLLEFFITVATVISNSNTVTPKHTVTQDTFSLRSSTGQLSAPELSRRTKRPRKVKRLRPEVVAPARWSKWRRKKTSSTCSSSDSALGAESRSTLKIYLV